MILLQTNCSSDAAKKSRLPKQCDGKRKRPLNLEILAQLEKVKMAQNIDENKTMENIESVSKQVKEVSDKNNEITRVVVDKLIDKPIIQIKDTQQNTTTATDVKAILPFPNNAVISIPTKEANITTPSQQIEAKNESKPNGLLNGFDKIGESLKNLFDNKDVSKTKDSLEDKKNSLNENKSILQNNDNQSNKENLKKNDTTTELTSKEIDLVIFQAVQEGKSPALAIEEYKKSKNQNNQPASSSESVQYIKKNGTVIADFTKSSNNKNDVDAPKKNKGSFLGIFGF